MSWWRVTVVSVELCSSSSCHWSELVPLFVFALQHHLKQRECCSKSNEKECEELLSDWWVTESAIFIINSRRKGKLCHFYTLKCVYGSWGEQLHMRWSNEAASNLMNCTPMRSLCGWVAVWVMYAPGFERGYMSFFRGIWSDQLFFNYPQWVQTVSSMP